MNNEQRKVVLEVGETNLEQLGFNLGLQELFKREFGKFFPRSGLKACPIKLKLVRASHTTLHWIFREEGNANFLLRVFFGKSKPDEKIIEGQQRARERSIVTQCRFMYEIEEVLSCDQGWLIIEAIRFFSDRLTLEGFLGGFRGFLEDFSTHFMHVIGKNIADNVHLVHISNPTAEMVGAKTYARLRFAKEKRRIYSEALRDILKRSDLYMPSGRDGLVEEKLRRRLLEGFGKFLRHWQGKGDQRLCLVHGDIQSGNILLPGYPTEPDVILIDFSPRVQLGEPRWDDGRFVGDLLQVYFETRSEQVKALIDGFIETAEALSGDELYRQGLCFGIFSMTLLKFYKKGRYIKDHEVAKTYFNNTLRIVEQGYFSWQER